jgi:hypothetical protein
MRLKHLARHFGITEQTAANFCRVDASIFAPAMATLVRRSKG